MAVRRVHNKIAAKFVNLPMKEIDEVNRMVDDPAMLKKYGKAPSATFFIVSIMPIISSSSVYLFPLLSHFP